MPDLRLSWALAALAALAAPALAEDCPDATDFDIEGFMRDTVGEPVSHDDTLPGDTVLQTVCHDRFCVGHNSHTRQPDWVVVFGDTVCVAQTATHTALYTTHCMRGYNARILNYYPKAPYIIVMKSFNCLAIAFH